MRAPRDKYDREFDQLRWSDVYTPQEWIERLEGELLRARRAASWGRWTLLAILVACVVHWVRSH